MMGLFMVTAGLAATYGPKLSLQTKIKAMKAKTKELTISQQPDNIIGYVCVHKGFEY